ncbi:MAG TPA: cytochrome C oxidase subunit IV family protein [Steroidobacteraceae bacterium]|nr:cytochrome C oxidase subunit IV family protein [Steroidobacteraceae bacterium]
MINRTYTHPKVYVLVWLVLLALLALTIGSAFLSLGWANTPLNLAISVTQAALVMLFSMHLRSAHPLLRIIAVIGFFGIAILISLSLFDVLAR